MDKSTNTVTFNNQNTKKKKALMIIILCLILIVSFFSLKLVYHRQNITLQSTWKSEKTGQILKFTSNNHVDFKGNLPYGIYHIISPNKMEYTVNEKTFLTFYKIEDSKLYWGLDENELECFEWVSN